MLWCHLRVVAKPVRFITGDGTAYVNTRFASEMIGSILPMVFLSWVVFTIGSKRVGTNQRCA